MGYKAFRRAYVSYTPWRANFKIYSALPFPNRPIAWADQERIAAGSAEHDPCDFQVGQKRFDDYLPMLSPSVM